MKKASNWKVSYSQNREDILLARALPDAGGFYIDVGAADPLEFSVTKLFYDRGWSGVNVEPQDDYYRKLVADRPRDTNLQLVLSDAPGTLTFYEAPTHPGWATTSEDVVRQMREQGIVVNAREVRAITLAEVCETHVGGAIDFLKIDVEGAERNVLLGADFTRWRPRVVVVEATEQGGSTPNHELWEDVILAGGYLYATFDGLNRYYVRSEEPDLVPVLRVPVNVFDEFAPYEFQSRIWELEALAKHLREVADERGHELTAARQEQADALARLAATGQERDAVTVERNDAWVECENLRAEIASLRAEVASLQSEAAGLAHDLAAATGREADLRHRLDAARSRLGALTGALSAAGR